MIQGIPRNQIKAMTHSEEVFERYLQERGIVYEREPRMIGKRKHPDFHVESRGRSFRFEVKEFGAFRGRVSGAHDPLPAIREKIEDARKQFKEYKYDCCAVVLHACNSTFRTFHPPWVMSAAFGNRVRIEDGTGALLSDKSLRVRFSGQRSPLDYL